MVRLFFRILVAIIANAIGLVVAAWILDDMSLDVSGFLIAVLIFTFVELLVHPALQKAALRHSDALSGGTALVAVLIALIVTDIISDGLSISGAVTWLLATVIVWGIVLVVGVLLPVTIFKKWLGERRR
jgi:hypothetical protein